EGPVHVVQHTPEVGDIKGPVATGNLIGAGGLKGDVPSTGLAPGDVEGAGGGVQRVDARWLFPVVDLDGVGSISAADVDPPLAVEIHRAVDGFAMPHVGDLAAPPRVGCVEVAVILDRISLERCPFPT